MRSLRHALDGQGAGGNVALMKKAAVGHTTALHAPASKMPAWTAPVAESAMFGPPKPAILPSCVRLPGDLPAGPNTDQDIGQAGDPDGDAAAAMSPDAEQLGAAFNGDGGSGAATAGTVSGKAVAGGGAGAAAGGAAGFAAFGSTLGALAKAAAVAGVIGLGAAAMSITAATTAQSDAGLPLISASLEYQAPYTSPAPGGGLLRGGTDVPESGGAVPDFSVAALDTRPAGGQGVGDPVLQGVATPSLLQRALDLPIGGQVPTSAPDEVGPSVTDASFMDAPPATLAPVTGPLVPIAALIDDGQIGPHGLPGAPDPRLNPDQQNQVPLYATDVPEPASLFVLLAGGFAALLVRRRAARLTPAADWTRLRPSP